MLKKQIALIAAGFALFGIALVKPAAADRTDAEEIVTEAIFTIKKIWNQPQYKEYVQRYAKDAKAVMLFPNVVKGGLFVGAEGGTGILLARAPNGEWSYPAFFSMGSASLGFQVGGQISEVMLLIMTGNGLKAILDDQIKIGGELSGAAGPNGAGLDASTTTNLDVDVLSYAVGEGVYIGVNIEGTLIWPREGLNRDYYEVNTTPEGIVLEGQAGNRHADDLRTTLRDTLP